MLNDKKILALIPARGGSKGLPNKNILPLAGKPLIAWTIETAKRSKYIDRLVLSTDDEKIKNVALQFGCEVPFMRPAELAQDSTPGIDVVLHALEILPERYDYVVLLQPTSPLRNAKDIDACIEKSLAENTACVSVCEPDKSPYWMFTFGENTTLNPLLKTHEVRRQDLPKSYVLNGAVYVSPVAELERVRTFLHEKTVGYIMPKLRSTDIDDAIDFAFCEMLLEKGFLNLSPGI